MKSLQLRGHRQIAEPHKYYLVRVIIFLWHAFSLFCFSQVWEFRVNSLHILSRPIFSFVDKALEQARYKKVFILFGT